MNKHDIIKALQKIDLSKKDYWINSGAALVLHGVREETSDIDLGCPTEVVNLLIEKGYRCHVLEDGTRKVILNEAIEIFENWFVEEIIHINDLPVGSLGSIRKQKEEMGRKKDKRDIKLIDNFIKNK